MGLQLRRFCGSQKSLDFLEPPSSKFSKYGRSVVILCGRARDSQSGPRMWTNDNRATYERKSCRYPSDLTDEEWAIMMPLMPPPRKARRHPVPGTPRSVERDPLRADDWVPVAPAARRIFPSKSVRARLPRVLGPRRRALARVHDALSRESAGDQGRNATASLAIVDSQSVKSAEKGGPRSTPAGTTRARRSKARSATSASIRKAC